MIFSWNSINSKQKLYKNNIIPLKYCTNQNFYNVFASLQTMKNYASITTQKKTIYLTQHRAQPYQHKPLKRHSAYRTRKSLFHRLSRTMNSWYYREVIRHDVTWKLNIVYRKPFANRYYLFFLRERMTRNRGKGQV